MSPLIGFLKTYYTFYNDVEERVEQKKTLSGKGRVFIMDDEAIIRKSAGKALSRLGYEVDYAKDEEEAIELYIRA